MRVWRQPPLEETGNNIPASIGTGMGSIPVPSVSLQARLAPTDSGYASLPHQAKPAVSNEIQVDADTTLLLEQTANTGEVGNTDFTDGGTTYSDDRSQASGSRTERYVAEFVDHLFGKLRDHLERGCVGRLVACLPNLLKAFAVKIGQSSSDRLHYEVMYFVHKHRRYDLTVACSLKLEK